MRVDDYLWMIDVIKVEKPECYHCNCFWCRSSCTGCDECQKSSSRKVECKLFTFRNKG